MATTEGGTSRPAEAEVARSVELGGIVFPVFDEKRKLRNFLFINARMLAGPGKGVWKYREQQHFIARRHRARVPPGRASTEEGRPTSRSWMKSSRPLNA